MATFKTPLLQDEEAGRKLAAALNGVLRQTKDTHLFTVDQLGDASTVVLTSMTVPTNAYISEFWVSNEDLDAGAGLTLQFGLYAAETFTSVTGGIKTKHYEEDVIAVEFMRFSTTSLQSATTNATNRYTANNKTEDEWQTPVWSLLGYDKDPRTILRVGVKVEVAAATPTAGGAAMITSYTTAQ